MTTTRIVRRRRRRQGLVSFGVVLWSAAGAVALISSSSSSTPSILPTTLAFGVLPTTTNARIKVGRTTNTFLHKTSNDSTPTTNNDEGAASDNNAKTKNKISILLLPAQFCVPADYDILWKELEAILADHPDNHDFTLGTTLVAPLRRTDWIKVAKQLPTFAFWEATLPVHRTLEWYFEAIEQGIATILQQEGPDAHICLVGHSIGGWVGRAYLGGLSRSSSAISKTIRTKNCSSLLTLGTPHISPDSAWVDQTRGLLREIEASEACSPQALADAGIAMTCICSGDITGRLLTTNIEEVVAAASYLPLLGQLDTPGDGIVPLALSKLPSPAQTVTLKMNTDDNDDNKTNNDKDKDSMRIRHSHVLPTPWNLWNPSAPSIPFPPETYPSYVSSRPVIEQWAGYIQ